MQPMSTNKRYTVMVFDKDGEPNPQRTQHFSRTEKSAAIEYLRDLTDVGVNARLEDREPETLWHTFRALLGWPVRTQHE
jgi:hypothetical protein